MKYKIIVDTDSENYDPIQWENIVSADKIATAIYDIREKARYRIKYFDNIPDKSEEYNEGFQDGMESIKKIIIDEIIDNGLTHI